MGRKTQIGIVVGLVLLLLGAGAAYAWDSAKKDEIADGRDDRRRRRRRPHEPTRPAALVEADLVEPLDKPVTVNYGKEHFTLDADELDVRADVDGMVDAALDASQEGGLPTRVWRYATGGEVDEDDRPPDRLLAPDARRLHHGRAAERQPAGRRRLGRADADDSLDPVPGQDGIEVETDQLRADLEQAVQSPHSRTVEAKVDKVKPEVTTERARGEVPALHRRSTARASSCASTSTSSWRRPTRSRSAPSATTRRRGSTTSRASRSTRPGTCPTQAGPATSPGRPCRRGRTTRSIARWMGFNGGAGIHGTNDIGSLGSAASHGCIRMAPTDVIELYDQVDVGDPVYIQ